MAGAFGQDAESDSTGTTTAPATTVEAPADELSGGTPEPADASEPTPSSESATEEETTPEMLDAEEISVPDNANRQAEIDSVEETTGPSDTAVPESGANEPVVIPGDSDDAMETQTAPVGEEGVPAVEPKPAFVTPSAPPKAFYFETVPTIESIGDAEESPEDDETGEQTRFHAHEQLLANLESREFYEAVRAAERVVTITENEYGDSSLELVTPLNNLATVLEYTSAFDSSEESYLRSISITELESGIFDASLIRPLLGLGVTYNAAGRYEEALDVFQRAQHISHRQSGVLSVDQLPALDGQTESHLSMGEPRRADRHQRFAFRVNEHEYGAKNPDLVPAIFKLAQWFRRSGQYSNARNMYKRAVNIIEINYGEDDLRLVEPLRGIAATRQLEGVRRSEGGAALKRAMQIIAVNQQTDASDRAQSIVELADWYVAYGMSSDGPTLYSQAWGILEEEQASQDEFKDFFGYPKQLIYIPPPAPIQGMLGSMRQIGERYVDFEFTVLPSGKVTQVHITDSNLPNVLKREVKRAVQRARYRPRLQDGEPVATPGVTLRQTYRSNRLPANVRPQ